MKKLLTMILILALILPAAASAASDLIVGCWYMLIDNYWYPEMMTNVGDYDYAVSIYLFAEDGNIYLLEGDIKDGTSTPVFISVGTWEKAQGLRNYSYKIMGLGEGTIRVEEGGDMYLYIPGGSVSMHVRKMMPFSPYSDYIFEEAGK